MNLLYTEPPAFRNGGRDEGWFCREHAYHTYFLLRLLGHEARIEIGHFAVRSSFGDGITSHGTDSDHAWVIVGDTAPIDLSMEFRYEDLPQLAGPIIGCGQKNGPYDIRYFKENTAFETWMEGPIASPEIGYLVKEYSSPRWR